MMRYVNWTTFLSILLAIQFLPAQVPAFDWVTSPVGSAISRSVTAGSTGDGYVTGMFHSVLNFDTTLTLTSTGFGDMFIARYDKDGGIVWAKSASGNYGDEAYCVESGYSGHIYVAGEFFSNEITFDSLTLINNHITPFHDDATKDIFLVKYNQDGQAIWARSGGGIGMEFVRDIAVDPRENVTLAGTLWSPSVAFGPYTLTKTGNVDVFIVQYDSSGQVRWAKNPAGTDQENAEGVCADTVGNVYLAGSFNSDSMQFDNITLICSSNNFDTYIVEYDPYGNAIWAENAQGNDWDETRSVALDKSGNIYLSGHFKSDSLKFGSEILYKSASNNIDMFLVKYDPNHQVMWARRSGGNIWSWVYPYEITIAPQGNIWITGVFVGDGLIFNSTVLPNHGSYDFYITKYNGFGEFLWAESIGGEGMDWGQGLTTDHFDNYYLAGYFESSFMVIGDTSLSNVPGQTKAFLVRITDQTTKINPLKSERGSFNIDLTNYPNPFNMTTQIEFSLDKSRFIELKIFNIIGEEVATLVSDRLSAGFYSYNWSPPPRIASGVYLYRFMAKPSFPGERDQYDVMRKMVLMK